MWRGNTAVLSPVVGDHEASACTAEDKPKYLASCHAHWLGASITSHTTCFPHPPTSTTTTPPLQVTVFVSLLALDARRIEQHRVDCAPCLTIRPPTQPLHVRRSYGGYMEGDGEGQAPELQVGGQCSTGQCSQAKHG
jgi:hypothetical protein